MAIKLRMVTGELEIQFHGRKILLYAFADRQLKPYVRELYDIRGENVLRDAPPDHPHHHGLMYGVWVNGINFWEEKDSPGIERSVEIPSYVVGRNEIGMPKAEFLQLIHWLPPARKAAKDSLTHALLIEQRTLTLTVDERTQEVALRWMSEFEVGPKTRQVKVTGNNYDGLGLRLPASFDHVARIEDSVQRPYTGANGQNVIPAQWTTVSGPLNGHDVMLAMFGGARNAGGETSFFTMREPFAYLSATQALDKAPLSYSAGDKFKLMYLLTVYPEPKSRAFLQEREVLWQKQQ